MAVPITDIRIKSRAASQAELLFPRVTTAELMKWMVGVLGSPEWDKEAEVCHGFLDNYRVSFAHGAGYLHIYFYIEDGVARVEECSQTASELPYQTSNSKLVAPGAPEESTRDLQTSDPYLILVWDSDELPDFEYRELKRALGDLVRAAGAVGLERIRSHDFGVPAEGVGQFL